MRKEHETQIENAIQALKARGEVNEVYFVACGGSQAVLMAGQYLFDRIFMRWQYLLIRFYLKLRTIFRMTNILST